MQDEIKNYIHRFTPSQSEIIKKLREVVLENMPDAHELIYHDALGYSFSKSPFDRIIYISPSRNHITFGFFFGGHLQDPEKLLEGTGKRMRHVKIKNVKETTNPALVDLVKESWKDAQISIPKLHNGKS